MGLFAKLRVANTRSQRQDSTKVDVPHFAQRPVIVAKPAARGLAEAERALPWPLRVKSLLTPVADGDALHGIPNGGREEIGWKPVFLLVTRRAVAASGGLQHGALAGAILPNESHDGELELDALTRSEER